MPTRKQYLLERASTKFSNPELISKFMDTEIYELARTEEFSGNDFSEIIPSMENIQSMLNEMVDIIIDNNIKNKELINEVQNQIIIFNNTFIERIKKLNYQEEIKNNFENRNIILNDFRNYLNNLYKGKDGNNLL